MSESLTVTDESVETLAEVLDDALTMAVANGTPTHFIADQAGDIARQCLSVLAQFGWFLVRDIDTEVPQRAGGGTAGANEASGGGYVRKQTTWSGVGASESPKSVDMLTDMAAAALNKGQTDGLG